MLKMAAHLAEAEAALTALNKNQESDQAALAAAASGVPVNGDAQPQVEDAEMQDDEDGDGDVEVVTEQRQGYNTAARPTYTLEFHLYREDKSTDYQATGEEIKTLLKDRLGVPGPGLVWSIDTAPFRKIVVEIHNSVSMSGLNVTQALQVKKGLWTKPLQAPEKDRLVFIKWATMNMKNEDIQTVMEHFGNLSEDVSNVIIEDKGKDDWTAWLNGAVTSERKCKMAIVTNIPSIIFVRGYKLRVDYTGQPKTCSRCGKWWAVCPGNGKADKCKKEGGEEKDLKVAFKNLVNRIKKTGRGTPAETPKVPSPDFIPDPDQVKFLGFPEDFGLKDFMKWMDEMGINILEPMCFKDGKPGAFSVATVEDESGEVLQLEAEDAAEMVTKLNGVEFKKKRIQVTMVSMCTPEKKKKVVTLDETPDGPLALMPPSPGAEGGEAREEGEGGKEGEDTEESEEESDDDDVLPELPKTPEVNTGARAKDKESLKINITAAGFTGGGTKLHKASRVAGEKDKRGDTSNSSIEASPVLPTKSKPGADKAIDSVTTRRDKKKYKK